MNKSWFVGQKKAKEGQEVGGEENKYQEVTVGKSEVGLGG